MVRVRFAPSPTGFLHVGGARTALYNWLFARKHGGAFILRIEDTDRTRYVEGAVEDIMESLQWLGLLWDEGPDVGGPYGPYFQSQRLEIYRKHAELLLEKGHAYKCFCSPERLEKLREEQRKAGLKPGYDRKCRYLSPEEREALEKSGRPYVIRLKVPLEGKTTFEDYLRGEITYENRELEDLILLKSDGYPTYHLANVVDDHLMRITHVLRADEWIPSTPYHVLLYRFFGWEPPVFAHLPVILAPGGKGKLSKRHGATAVREFREMGYLSEAMVNFLALLGWSPGGDREILSLQEMVELFDLKRVGKRGAVFDFAKLRWMNGEYIRMKDDEELYRLLLPFFKKAGRLRSEEDRKTLRRIIPLLKERAKTLQDFVEMSDYFFTDDFPYEPKGVKKHFRDPAVWDRLRLLIERLDTLDVWDAPHIEQEIRKLAAELGVGAAKLIHPTRVAVTGRTVGPGLFELMEVLGKATCLRRLRRALQVLPRELETLEEEAPS